MLPDEFIDRFAVVGDVDELHASACASSSALGLDRVVITGPSFGADREAAGVHHRLVTDELLPALRDT